MADYVALLRGVNVGGVKVKMADLVELLQGLGFGSVRTLLASGNSVFTSEMPAVEVKERVESALADRYERSIKVHVMTIAELSQVLDAYPFECCEGWHRYVVFVLEQVPLGELVGLDLDPDVEIVQQGEGVIYWTVERGATLTSAFGKKTGSSRFKDVLTNRNLNTLEKLVATKP